MQIKFKSPLARWTPALVVMAAIFFFSSLPSADMPNFDLIDRIVKKGGHMLGYGLLAASYAFAMKLNARKLWLAWLLALVYAATDELHQAFVPGRNPSVWDVLIFDSGGTLIALWLIWRRRRG